MSFSSGELKLKNEKSNSDKNNDNNNIIKSNKEKYKINKEDHPLEFYDLGKINKNSNNNSSTYYNSSSLSSPRLRINKSSHNLFDRNLLSVNHSYFDKLKQVKNITSTFQLNKEQNNYLNPLLAYKTRRDETKENQKRNNINSLEWLNIIKSKLFSMDINSEILKGKNISRKKFYEEKNKELLFPKKIKDNSFENNNSKYNSSYQVENKNNVSDGCDYNYNTIKSIENIFNCKRFKKDSENLNKLKTNYEKQEKYADYWKKLRIEKSHSTDALINKESKKFNEKLLKNKFFYFDKNYTNIIRHKNWWKIDP